MMLRDECPVPYYATFDKEPATLSESTWRHNAWRANRRQVWNALKATGASWKRLDRFSNCGSELWLCIDDADNRPTLSSQKCRDRWCQPCSRETAATVSAQMEQLINPNDTRFLTLTMRHNDTRLSDQLTRLHASYLALRRRVLWKSKVTAAVAAIEIKTGRDGRWHPHIHAIAKGQYIPIHDLAQEWHRVTGDSYVVDIKKVTDIDHARAYVTKYMTKPVSQDVYENPDRLSEAIVSLKGRRMLITSGAWNKVKLRRKVKRSELPRRIARLEQIYRQDNEEHSRWRDVIARNWPLLHAIYTPRDQEPTVF